MSVVVRRQDLDDGIDAAERKKMLPLSEEDRNLRMAELRSLNVDLPKDQLLMLLRCVESGTVGGGGGGGLRDTWMYISERGGSVRKHLTEASRSS